MQTQYDYIRTDLTPGDWAIFWDSQTPDRFIIARYSHSEQQRPLTGIGRRAANTLQSAWRSRSFIRQSKK